MSRISRGIRAATKAACLSTAKRFKVGAAIMSGPEVLSIGWNNTLKTHPASTTRYSCQHAEFSAILGNDKKALVGSTMFVVRTMRSGGLGMARPCVECAKLIAQVGIEKIYYSDEHGQIVLEGA